METVRVIDIQNGGRVYEVEKKRAEIWCTSYRSRFKYEGAPPPPLTQKDVEMPKGIPVGFVPLPDGVHTLKIEKVESGIDQTYKKPQEVAHCIANGDTAGVRYNLYFPHESKKWYDQGVKAGIIHTEGEDWNIIIGSECMALVQNGKIVSIFARA